MNVAIVTWIGTGNFGTSLQSYALHEYLKQKGYNVCLLNEVSNNRKSIIARIKNILIHTKSSLKIFLSKTGIIKSNSHKISSFNELNYNIINVRSGDTESIVANTDVFVTGSDQIWNCYHSFSPFMFLSFAGEKKRVAYASSIGTKDFPCSCASEVKKYLSLFKNIGVREKSACLYLKTFLGREDIKQVLDPTFLLDSSHWSHFSNNATIEFDVPKEYIFCYFIGNNTSYGPLLEKIKKQIGIESVIVIQSLENKNFNSKDCRIYKQAGPYEFVYLLRNSTMVCTDSFHACALSINLSKQFVVFKRFNDDDPKSQNTRIYDLLDVFDIKQCMSEDARTIPYINFEPVQNTLNEMREDSSNYLLSSIGN